MLSTRYAKTQRCVWQNAGKGALHFSHAKKTQLRKKRTAKRPITRRTITGSARTPGTDKGRWHKVH